MHLVSVVVLAGALLVGISKQKCSCKGNSGPSESVIQEPLPAPEVKNLPPSASSEPAPKEGQQSLQAEVQKLKTALSWNFGVFWVALTLVCTLMLIAGRVIIEDPINKTMSSLLVFILYCVTLLVGILIHQGV